jgi:hypothetical protein
VQNDRSRLQANTVKRTALVLGGALYGSEGQTDYKAQQHVLGLTNRRAMAIGIVSALGTRSLLADLEKMAANLLHVDAATIRSVHSGFDLNGIVSRVLVYGALSNCHVLHIPVLLRSR